MKLKFTEYTNHAVTMTEDEAIRTMNERFANGERFVGHWDNGYSYCGADALSFKSGEEIVSYLKKEVEKRFGERAPTERELCNYSGYPYSGIICDDQGRFRICMVKNPKRYSEVSDS